MDYYLVDYQNVSKAGLDGLSKLGQDDVICIFYTDNSDSISFGLHRRLNESQATISYKKVMEGTKNALDFQLASFLGYIIRENEDKPYRYHIVSKDKGFECLVNFWKKKAAVDHVINVVKENEPAKGAGKAENEGQAEQDEFIQAVCQLIHDPEDAAIVAKIIREHKTKPEINNAFMKTFPSKNHQKASQIYRAIKPLIADKKGK